MIVAPKQDRHVHASQSAVATDLTTGGTMMTEEERKEWKKLEKIVQLFRNIDKEMPLQRVALFIEVVLREGQAKVELDRKVKIGETHIGEHLKYGADRDWWNYNKGERGELIYVRGGGKNLIANITHTLMEAHERKKEHSTSR